MRRTQVIFLIIGCVPLIAGLLMIAATVIAAPAPFTPPQEEAVYVGSGTCLTCHASFEHAWSDTLHPIMIQDVLSNPAIVVADFGTGADLRQVEIGSEARAYTPADVTFTIDADGSQRYVMHTATGYTVLPGEWSITDATWVEADANNWLTSCADCHTTGYDPETQSWSELNVGCEACHGAGSFHAETAPYNLRGTIQANLNTAICAQCHTGNGNFELDWHLYPPDSVIGDTKDWMAILLNVLGM